VFPAGSVPAALQRFFTKEHLDVLREISPVECAIRQGYCANVWCGWTVS
jgi:K+-sensing histidine kinase KdpD